MTDAPPDAGARIVARCRALAEVSEESRRLVRPFGTAAMVRANRLVGGWMSEAGMAVHLDAAGNLVGHLAGTDPGAGTFLLGSHLDTVRDAGAFDGPLGVLCAVECVARLAADPPPFGVDVLGFGDEEGLRFGTAYLGSRAVAGTFDPALLELEDEEGERLATAMRSLGGNPARLPSASRRGERLLGYCEVHMEQGPVLEGLGAPVGIVTAIAGATRAQLRFTGLAGHAGTVPMDVRQDALCAAAEWVLAVERTGAATDGMVATVGRLSARPGAPNVVPGEVVAFLDVRHADDDVRRVVARELLEDAEAICARRGIGVSWEERLDNPAVAVDRELRRVLETAISAEGLDVHELLSGAGHDAVALADLVGVSMLFVRCRDGLSHHPGEDVSAADAGVAVAVLERFLRALAA